LGTTLDLFGPRRRKNAQDRFNQRGRVVKYMLLLLILGMALAGSLSLMVLDPISLITRGLGSFILPGADQMALNLERSLYDITALQGGLDWFEASVRIPLFPADVWRAWNWLPGLLLVGVVLLNFAAPRFWCRYLCPLGGLLGLISRVAILRRIVGQDACRNCTRCVRSCPTGTIDPGKGFASDPAECIVCMDCLPECPTPNGQKFGRVPGLASPQAYDPGRRQTILALGAGLLAGVLTPLIPAALRRSERLIRPPGAQRDTAFLASCIRCATCLKVCPTSGLQPALWESGVDGLWSPTLVPRLGYCDYSCNACGQVCPTGAIPSLDLETKRATKIGTASVNQDRCLPWSQNTPCIVCEEMCPRAPKAIELDTLKMTDASGQAIELQRPRVIPERCIGCGICEYKCPLEGEAAITVRGLIEPT
jgi:ferredoxin